MHFDPVDAHFDLFMDLSDDIVRRMHNPRIPSGALIGQQPRGGAADTVDQHIAARGHAWPLNHTTFNGIAKIDPHIKDTIRIKEAGKTGAQHLLRVYAGNERR